ncbi:hypothetical protein IGI77_003411 [Enterococcus sp. DIV0213h]
MIFLMILRNKFTYILIEFSINNFNLLSYEYHIFILFIPTRYYDSLHYLDILHTNKKTLHNLNCEAPENIDIKRLTF